MIDKLVLIFLPYECLNYRKVEQKFGIYEHISMEVVAHSLN